MPDFQSPSQACSEEAAAAPKSVLNLRWASAFFSKAHADRGKERYRRASLTASASILSQALAVLISIVSVPLTVHYLGQERYGVWLTISSLMTWMTMTDFGLTGNALINLISGSAWHRQSRSGAAIREFHVLDSDCDYSEHWDNRRILV